jgi:hypothetical protein
MFPFNPQLVRSSNQKIQGQSAQRTIEYRRLGLKPSLQNSGLAQSGYEFYRNSAAVSESHTYAQ